MPLENDLSVVECLVDLVQEKRDKHCYSFCYTRGQIKKDCFSLFFLEDRPTRI